ncbi:hypothetical protein SAMN05444722_3547 [Rhodovulum sp. ES.010]|uniref:hypothetical protein n=1 Tax=Rhodovulum sp. ES.010 TaxID=1882821 RepID=UPI00092BC1F0|nr:hypothetical protein [Rhodovulum sp. ES.010]SIO55927.1 hypothetical protein SAMN05444722_3547 [Rhodovulum sp. ES.010]
MKRHNTAQADAATAGGPAADRWDIWQEALSAAGTGPAADAAALEPLLDRVARRAVAE